MSKAVDLAFLEKIAPELTGTAITAVDVLTVMADNGVPKKELVRVASNGKLLNDIIQEFDHEIFSDGEVWKPIMQRAITTTSWGRYE